MDPQGYTTAEEIASGVLNWVLADQPGGGPVVRSLDPSTLAKLAEAEQLRESEVLTLYAYVHILKKIDHSLAARADDVGGALGVGDAFRDECENLAERLLAGAPEGLTARGVTEAPPVEVMGAITTAVADYHARNRPPREKLEGLRSIIFEHPADRRWLGLLKAIPLFGTIVGKFVDVAKRAIEIDLIADTILATEMSVPWLYEVYRETCEALQVDDPPPLYVKMGGINAYTTGADEPFIVVAAGAASLLDREELLFVLGHELGHVMAGHVRYQTMVQVLLGGGKSQLPGASLARLLADITFAPVLMAWFRRAEFTGDRAGLLACQNREAALRMMMKMGGYPPSLYSQMRTRSIVQQAETYRQKVEGSLVDSLFDISNMWTRSHPRVVMRAAELLDWVEDGSYADIVHASSEERRALADRVASDPGMAELARVAARSLAAWGAKEFGVPRNVAAPPARRMVHLGESPRGTPLEPVLRVELRIKKESAAEVKYFLLVLFNRGGKPIRMTIDLAMAADWDSVPEELRKEFINSGGAEHVRVLYTPGS